MYSLDCKIDEYCKSKKIVYTRYADDLSFSTSEKGILNKCYEDITNIIAKSISPKLIINNSKTVFLSKKYCRRITGIVITNDNKLSLGKEKKKLLRSKIHRFTNGNLSVEEIDKLRGELSYANYIEENFLHKMSVKYGVNIIQTLMKSYL